MELKQINVDIKNNIVYLVMDSGFISLLFCDHKIIPFSQEDFRTSKDLGYIDLLCFLLFHKLISISVGFSYERSEITFQDLITLVIEKIFDNLEANGYEKILDFSCTNPDIINKLMIN